MIERAGSPSASDLPCLRIEPNFNRILRAIWRVFAGSAVLSVAALVLFVGHSSSVLAQTLAPAWNQLSPATTPPARSAPGVAYDSATAQVVMFGGSALNDTWVWNGTDWTNATPSSSGNPAPRRNMAMAYDAATNQVVMFGGNESTTFGDTWLWNGTSWSQVTGLSTLPPARSNAVMAYDAATQQLVLFGGVDTNGNLLGDTWLWNGSSWSQASLAAHPSAREGASIDYDGALGELILFGGFDGNYDNDVWAWNGSTWIPLSPTNTAPSGRSGAALAYDAAVGQVVVFGGANASGWVGDTWVLSGTSNIALTWTQQTATGPSARNVSATAYDAAQGLVVMFGGESTSGSLSDTWTWGAPQNFGNINVCPPGGSGQQPCNSTMPLIFNFVADSTTIGSIQVVTQGASNLDFTLANTAGTNCAGNTWSVGSSCTVLVTFTPQAPGLRMGAVELFDNSSPANLLVSVPIYGVGQAPEIAFGLGTQTTVPTSGLSLTSGVAVDASGNVYISTQNNQVVKVTPNGVQTTVPATGLSYPYDIAVDGAGDVFLADYQNNRVVEVTPGGVQTVVPATGLNGPTGVAVDGAGDVFITDELNDRVVKVTPGGVQTTVPTSGITKPFWPAVDAAGDVFFLDDGHEQVVKVTPDGIQSTVPATGLVAVNGIAVDAAGDVFISDQVLDEVVEVTPSGAQTTLATSGLSVPAGVAVDWLGNVFIADRANNQVVKVSRSPAPSFNFGSVNVGARSADLATTIQNIGNQTLTGSMGSPTTPDFGEDLVNSTCTAGNGISLAPGATCDESFYAQPTAAGALNGTVTVSDNSFNGSPATQTIQLAATGQGGVSGDSINLTLAGSGRGAITDNLADINCSLSAGAISGSCASSYPANTQLTLTAAPSLGSIFQGWGGACASSGTSPTCTLTVNAPAIAVNATFSQQSFGAVNVCPGGTSVQCAGSILGVTFNLLANTTVGGIRVVTQGATGLDFSLGSGSTCTGTFSTAGSCVVNVNFTPLAPGLRLGAVSLYDNNSNLVATNLISGVGLGPLAAFSPGAQVPVNTGNFSLNYPNGLLTDAAGNLFLANGDNRQVLKISPYGSVTTVPASGLNLPQGMAEDGAGNLFIANNSGTILEIPAGCTTSSCQQSISNPFGFQSELGIAVDAAGNLFVGDFLSGQVEEVPANGGPQSIVYNPTGCGNAPGCSDPVDLTTDAAGNLFIADFGLKTVAEVPVGCTTQSCVKAIGTGWSQPEDVAVDAAGDVFVADQGLRQIVEVPAGCKTSACQIVLVSNVTTVALSVDTLGNLFYDDTQNELVLKLARSQPPSLSFPLTDANSTSAAQSVFLQNIGNQPLTGSVALSGLAPHFTAADTCGSNFSLAPGIACSDAFTFTPKTTGYLAGYADYSDNTLNLSSAVVLQQVNMSGLAGQNGQAVTAAVPNVVGLVQSAATSTITAAGLSAGTISMAPSSLVPAGSVIASNPPAGTQVSFGTAVNLQISNGQTPASTPNPLSLLNNWFVTGDYATGSVSFSSSQPGATVSGTISIASSSGPGSPGVPTGADLIDGFLYWATLESAGLPSGANATFLGYPVSGQQIGKDLPNYTIGNQTGTLRFYRADINAWFQNGAGGIRNGSGNFAVSLPASGTSGVLLTQGASLVVIYRVLSPKFPLKAVVIYDGSGLPLSSTTQNMQGFYDAAGGGNASGEFTPIFTDANGWNTSTATLPLLQPDQFNAPLNAGAAYGAVILSTSVANHDNDGILDSWKTGPGAGDFHAGQPGYYDVKTGAWVGLPGAKSGQKDLFVQLDWMCGALNPDGSCSSSAENLFPAPDAQGNDPLAMVQQAFTNSGIALHLQLGNIVPESTCNDSDPGNSGQLCQFPGEPGVVGWKNSLEFSKAWPRNFASCITGGDCSPRFAYGQKDSYHYVLFGHSLAIPAWNTRYGSLTSINAVAGGTTTIVTTDRGTGINACPSRITISGIQGMPSLNGVYNTSSCPDDSTVIISTPAAVKTSWIYPNNTLPEPVIGITSGTVTSISGYSDLGGADSAVTLALWETDPSQSMSKKATVIAGTLFHEIGHTLGLSHGGIYYAPGSYVPTFEANCKPNYQSSMNYLFQLDGVGPASAIAYSNQTLTTITQSSFGSATQLLDTGVPGAPATFPTSTWYQSSAPDTSTSKATLHCDGTPLGSDVGYRVSGSISPITPAWANGQNITFDGVPYSTLHGFNDNANIDLRQVGATGGQYASIASVLSFGSAATSLDIAPGGSVSVEPGGTVTLGAGGSITVPGGSVTIPSNGTISGGGTITLGGGGNVTLGGSGVDTITPGNNGIVGLPAGGTVTLGGGGTITLGGGGTVTLGGGGTVTLGGGGTITLGGGGATITIPAGGSYTIPAGGGTVTLGGGGTVTLGGGGTVTLGGGGTVTLGGGGTVTLGGGGAVTLGGGGTVTLGGGGTVTLGGGGAVTLGGGGTITLGGGGTVTLGGGGAVTLGGGGTVTLGGGGAITLGGGGTVTLGGGGTVTLGAGGNITLGGAGGTVTLGGGGSITLGAGGGQINGVQEPAGGPYQVPAGGTVTLGGGGTITLGGGGTVTLGGGGVVTLGGGGVVTLGGGGAITLGGGGAITLGGGGTVTLGGGGVTTTELDYNTANSVVRPPTAPTSTTTTAGIVINWTAPGFGVVQTYTIYRSVNGGTPVVIGSVSGQNGNAPATTFTDTNPPAGKLAYTITTTLVPDQGTNTQRQSSPSVPAVVTLDQTLVFNPPLPSSVPVSASTIKVTAIAESIMSGQTTLTPNGQQVSFAATGSCSIASQSFSSPTSIAMVSLNGAGSCTITASQAGDSTTVPTPSPAYNAAPPISGTIMVEPANSNLKSQTITFPQLSNVQYGSNPVPVAATTTSGLQITFTASGPCNVTGASIAITGAGTCAVTASQPGNSTYSAASVTQSFKIFPAVLTVAANNFTITLGQQIPTLTSMPITGFVNGDSPSVVTGTPALSTTATGSSPVGTYPIMVSTGSLAAANYDFLFVPGTLKIQFSSGGSCDGAPGHQILPPIDPSGSSVFKQGRTVPAQFRVCDAKGVSIGTGVVKSFYLTAIVNGTVTQTVETVVDTSNPDTAFRFDPTAQEWIFNISTQSLAASKTYVYTILLNDGTSIGFQYGLK